MNQECSIRTLRLQLRPWDRGDLTKLVELSKDAGCRVPWGVFRAPMDLGVASHWIDRATEGMRSQKLGSWSVWSLNGELVGCLNYLYRALDGKLADLPVLEFRFAQICYDAGLALEAVSALMGLLGELHNLETVYTFLAPGDANGRRLAEALTMEWCGSARYEQNKVEVFGIKPEPKVIALLKAPTASAGETRSAAAV